MYLFYKNRRPTKFEQISSTHDWALIKECKEDAELLDCADVSYYECAKCSMISMKTWMSTYPSHTLDVSKKDIMSYCCRTPRGLNERMSIACDEFTWAEFRLKRLMK